MFHLYLIIFQEYKFLYKTMINYIAINLKFSLQTSKVLTFLYYSKFLSQTYQETKLLQSQIKILLLSIDLNQRMTFD